MDIVLFIVGIILFVGLVVLHELGHAVAAKRNGVEVEEFGIGFPPRAWAKKLKNKTLFSVNWLPLGGFVKLKGENDAATGPGSYGGASLWAKTKILLAGVVVNWLTAVAIFTLLALFGMPKVLPNQFNIPADNVTSVSAVQATLVSPGSPANRAGVQIGDTLVSLAGEPINSAERFSEQTKSHAGQKVDLVVVHEGVQRTLDVTLNQDNTGQGYLGVGTAERASQRATWSAPIVGVGVTFQFTYETFKGLFGTLGNLFQAKFEEAGKDVAGPVGIISILKDSSSLGVAPVLFLIGVISLTLAVMNVLPIPALDGGRLFVTLLFRAMRKKLTKEREEAIQAAGMVVLLLLVAVITYVDVRRFF